MRLLLDTHALIWWFAGDERLPVLVRDLIDDDANTVFASAASAYEIAFKHRRGKLDNVGRLALGFEVEIARENFSPLPITVAVAIRAGAFDHAHRDPFDRLLIAQALQDDLTLVSNEKLFDSFAVARIW